MNLRFRELRAGKKLSQEKIAVHLHIARESYSRYESGKREMSYSVLCRLADLYGVSIDYLLGRISKRPLEISDMEADVIEKLRKLDERGQNSVLAVLHNEYANCTPQVN